MNHSEMAELSIPKYNGHHSVSNMKTKVFLCQSNFLFYLKRLNVRGEIKLKQLEFHCNITAANELPETLFARLKMQRKIIRVFVASSCVCSLMV